MQVYVNGRGIRLDKQHYLGQGGEGAVYARGTTAYKIYTDPKKMIPVAKIQELSVLQDKRIVKPETVITDQKGHPIGYTMFCVKGGYALCQIFPRSFRERNGLDISQITNLVRELQEGVHHVHQAKILLVDLNEMNFLVSKKFDKIFFIDADSYQTRSFPATALMESIRDRHMKGQHAFTELTDWFAFGIVSFQMFCGIHPYKGKHQQLKGLDARMNANVSVFNSSVHVPKAAYPVTVIPTGYRDWYRAVFEDGKRVPPPVQPGMVMVIVPDLRKVVGTNLLDIVEVYAYGDDDCRVRGVYDLGQHTTVVTDAQVWLNGHSIPERGRFVKAVAYSTRSNKAVSVIELDRETPTGGGLRLHNLTDRKDIPFLLKPSDMMAYDGRVYLKVHDKVHELVLTDVGSDIVATTKLAVTVLENATQMFPGVVLQNLLGSMHVSLFPKSGMTMQVMVKELNGCRVVDARYDRGVLMVIGEKRGQYNRLVFRFDDAHKTYDLRMVKNITPSGLNFVVLDSGVAICMNEDEKLEMFLAQKDHPKLSYVEDPVLGGDMTLVRVKGQLHFYRGNKLYRMSMKKSS